ncbi:hypothetical protein BGZ91_005462 [Linnemannia elongata]|nr:hypothetical protein BGZ91_005462 [Linnemannia elongata]
MISVGRALQGMGTGFTVQSALGLLTTTYLFGPEHNKALAIFGGTGVHLLFLMGRGFPEWKVVAFVFVDMVSFTPGIVAIIYYLSEGSAAGWKAASTLALLVVGIALLIGFVVY